MIGCEDRLRNDLYCVGWGVKLYSNQTKANQCATPCVCVCVCADDELQVCRGRRGGMTCCTAAMERKLVARSRTEYVDRLTRTLQHQQRAFSAHTHALNSQYDSHARARLAARQTDRRTRSSHMGPDLQYILRFIVRLSYVYRKIDLRQ